MRAPGTPPTLPGDFPCPASRACSSRSARPSTCCATRCSSFAADEIAPRAAEIDRDNLFPADLWQQARRPRPARHDGERGVRRHATWATSRTSSRWRRSRAPRPRSACPTARTPTCASTRSTATAATRRRQKYLPKLVSGEHVGALAMSEPNAGSDVVSMKLRAETQGRPLRAQRQQDVDHQRPRRRHAGRLRQDRARSRARSGITAFIVEKGFKGFSRRAEARQARHARLQHLRAGLRGLRSAGRERARRRGRRRQGADERPRLRARGARRAARSASWPPCMDVVLPYVHERKQFGQPIGEFQLMQGKLADMYTTWQACRAYVYAVGQACDRGDHARTLRKDAAGAILYCGREGDLDGGRGDPGARRQRLHQRVPDRPPVARRQALRDRRRHHRDPPHADRPRAVRRDA